MTNQLRIEGYSLLSNIHSYYSDNLLGVNKYLKGFTFYDIEFKTKLEDKYPNTENSLDLVKNNFSILSELYSRYPERMESLNSCLKYMCHVKEQENSIKDKEINH